jgi:hypothetical protein
MIPRAPEAIVQAAAMDSERRDLYVEGLHDKLVLEFLCGKTRDRGVRILPVDEALDLCHSEGGSKGRLLVLAQTAQQKGVQNLRFFVDRDLDPFIGAAVPGNTWQTDFPDFEGYLLNVAALSKALRLSYSNPQTDILSLLDSLITICRELGLLRVLSCRNNLALPVTKTKKTRCVELRNGIVAFDCDRFLTAVLQEGHINLSRKSALIDGLQAIKKELNDAPSVQFVRGKDFIEISIIALRRLGIDSKEFGRVLWATLDKKTALGHPTLSCVVEFLSRTTEQEN